MAEPDEPNEPKIPHAIQNLLLVVVALVAATTFQAAVNPPGGVWQDTTKAADKVTIISLAGKSILGSDPGQYKIFVFCNTVAFSSSIFVIVALIYDMPFFEVTYLAILAMMVTYGTSVAAVRPPDTTSHIYMMSLAYFLPLIVFVLRRPDVRLQIKKWFRNFNKKGNK